MTDTKPIRRIANPATRTTLAKVGHTDARWYIVDASGQTLGRLASAIAMRDEICYVGGSAAPKAPATEAEAGSSGSHRTVRLAVETEGDSVVGAGAVECGDYHRIAP